jgi:hypothetical protein
LPFVSDLDREKVITVFFTRSIGWPVMSNPPMDMESVVDAERNGGILSPVDFEWVGVERRCLFGAAMRPENVILRQVPPSLFGRSGREAGREGFGMLLLTPLGYDRIATTYKSPPYQADLAVPIAAHRRAIETTGIFSSSVSRNGRLVTLRLSATITSPKFAARGTVQARLLRRPPQLTVYAPMDRRNL